MRGSFLVPGLVTGARLAAGLAADLDAGLAKDFAAGSPLVTWPLCRLRAAAGLDLRKLLAPLA